MMNQKEFIMFVKENDLVRNDLIKIIMIKQKQAKIIIEKFWKKRKFMDSREYEKRLKDGAWNENLIDDLNISLENLRKNKKLDVFDILFLKRYKIIDDDYEINYDLID